MLVDEEECGCGGQRGDYDGRQRVQQVELADQDVVRDHRDLEGDDHRRHQRQEDRLVPFCLEIDEAESGKHTDQDLSESDEDGGDCRVPQPVEEVVLLEDDAEIVQRGVFRKEADPVAEQFCRELEGGTHHPEQGEYVAEDKQEQEDDQRDISWGDSLFLPIGSGISISSHNSRTLQRFSSWRW